MLENKKISPNILIGLFLVVMGGLYMLDSLEVLPFEISFHFWSFPGLLLLVGIFIIAVSNKKLPGLVLIIIAAFLEFPIIWPVFLILIGLFIIFRHKIELGKYFTFQLNFNKNSGKYLDDTAIFGGAKKILNTENFNGGQIIAIFGGSEIDLTSCKLAPGQNIIDVTILFGGTSILVPRDWNVHIDVVPVFGGFSDDRRKDPNIVFDKDRTLVVKGFVLFGGGEIKH